MNEETDALVLAIHERLGSGEGLSFQAVLDADALVRERRQAKARLKAELSAIEREPLHGGSRSLDWRKRHAYVLHRIRAMVGEIVSAEQQAVDVRASAKAARVEVALREIALLSRDDAAWSDVTEARRMVLALTRWAFRDPAGSPYAKALGR